MCLQTYGELDYLYKLMQDNGIQGLDQEVLSGQQFVWDDSLVVDQQINQAFASTSTVYATSVGDLGSVFFVDTVEGGQTIQPNPTPVAPEGEGAGQYSVTLGTSFTSNADGLTVITPLDINGNLLIGADLVQVEKEIKPLKASQYTWNKNTGTLTLLDGLTCDNLETMFFLYSKIVSV